MRQFSTNIVKMSKRVSEFPTVLDSQQFNSFQISYKVEGVVQGVNYRYEKTHANPIRRDAYFLQVPGPWTKQTVSI